MSFCIYSGGSMAGSTAEFFRQRFLEKLGQLDAKTAAVVELLVVNCELRERGILEWLEIPIGDEIPDELKSRFLASQYRIQVLLREIGLPSDLTNAKPPVSRELERVSPQ